MSGVISGNSLQDLPTLSYDPTSSCTLIDPYQCFVDGNSKSIVKNDREKKGGFIVTKATSLFQLANDCPHIAEVGLATFLILTRTQNKKNRSHVETFNALTTNCIGFLHPHPQRVNYSTIIIIIFLFILTIFITINVRRLSFTEFPLQTQGLVANTKPSMKGIITGKTRYRIAILHQKQKDQEYGMASPSLRLCRDVSGHKHHNKLIKLKQTILITFI